MLKMSASETNSGDQKLVVVSVMANLESFASH